MENTNPQQTRYTKAVNSLIEKIKDDPNVIAIFLKGSLAYDVVWEKSDIDLSLIIRDQKINQREYALYEDNIQVNVEIYQRSDFKRLLEKNRGGHIMHSMFAKGKFVFTKDEDLIEYVEEFKNIGEYDMKVSLFYITMELLGTKEKALKWLTIKNDQTYSQFYVVKCADEIARMEVCKNRIIPTREAILQAEELNPKLMEKFYHMPLSKKLSKEELSTLIEEMDEYLDTYLDIIKEVADECLGDGEIKTLTQLCKYYGSNPHFIHSVFDYLNEKGYIEKISQEIRITPKGKQNVEEIAYIKPIFNV